MKDEVEKFIDRISNYKIIRSAEDTEYELQKKWHKKRINECYAFLKYLHLRKDSLALKQEIDAVKSLTRDVEKDFLKWRKNVSKNS